MEGSAFKIFDMLASGQLTSKAIYIVAKLNIAEFLKDGPKSMEVLARDKDLFIGCCECWLALGYLLLPMASFTLSETQDSVRNFALLFGLESFKKAR